MAPVSMGASAVNSNGGASSSSTPFDMFNWKPYKLIKIAYNEFKFKLQLLENVSLIERVPHLSLPL